MELRQAAREASDCKLEAMPLCLQRLVKRQTTTNKNMIEHGNVEVKRDAQGMWLHPAFPWNSVKEDTDITPYLKEWGYEGRFRALDDDASDAIVERYANSNDPDCSYWTPTPPKGEGWILGAIYDTEDGPVACFLKPLNDQSLPTLGHDQGNTTKAK